MTTRHRYHIFGEIRTVKIGHLKSEQDYRAKRYNLARVHRSLSSLLGRLVTPNSAVSALLAISLLGFSHATFV